MWTESETISINFLYSARLKSMGLSTLMTLFDSVIACIGYFENSGSLSCRDFQMVTYFNI